MNGCLSDESPFYCREKLARHARRLHRRQLARICVDQWFRFVKHQIMRRYLSRWREYSWEARRGWRLKIKADFHFRMTRLFACYNGWKRYLITRQQKHQRRRLAQQFYWHHTLHDRFSHWQNCFQSMQTRNALVKRMGDRHVLNRNLERWSLFLLLSRYHRRRLELAFAHLYKRLLHSTLQGWKAGVIRQRLLSQQQQQLHSRHVMWTQRQTLRQWQEAQIRHQAWLQLKQKAAEAGNLALQRRSLLQWQRYHCHRQKCSALAQAGREFLRDHLLQRSWEAWEERQLLARKQLPPVEVMQHVLHRRLHFLSWHLLTQQRRQLSRLGQMLSSQLQQHHRRSMLRHWRKLSGMMQAGRRLFMRMMLQRWRQAAWHQQAEKWSAQELRLSRKRQRFQAWQHIARHLQRILSLHSHLSQLQNRLRSGLILAAWRSATQEAIHLSHLQQQGRHLLWRRRTSQSLRHWVQAFRRRQAGIVALQQQRSRRERMEIWTEWKQAVALGLSADWSA